jgi:hypothetical protein
LKRFVRRLVACAARAFKRVHGPLEVAEVVES